MGSLGTYFNLIRHAGTFKNGIKANFLMTEIDFGLEKTAVVLEPLLRDTLRKDALAVDFVHRITDPLPASYFLILAGSHLKYISKNDPDTFMEWYTHVYGTDPIQWPDQPQINTNIESWFPEIELGFITQTHGWRKFYWSLEDLGLEAEPKVLHGSRFDKKFKGDGFIFCMVIFSKNGKTPILTTLNEKRWQRENAANGLSPENP